jgi:hypothetical protein
MLNSERRGARFLTNLLIGGTLIFASLARPSALAAEPVAVRFSEGLVHGFLALRTLDGNLLADGELTQVARGDRVTNHLVFRFRDGSLHDETVVFSQRRVFQLISDHLVQKGPAFEQAVDVSIDGVTGQVSVRYVEDGKEKVATEHVDATDLANGMTLTLFKNIQPDAGETKVAMVAVTPKPRLVKLAVASVGEEPFSFGETTLKATHFVIKVQLGGVAGVVAPIVGKQPPDFHVWVIGGKAPAFIKSEGPLYAGGPIWRIQLTSPVWPQSSQDRRENKEHQK